MNDNSNSPNIGTTPFREASVPLAMYQEMENKLNKSIENMTEKRDILDRRNQELMAIISRLEEKNSENRWQNISDFFKFIVIAAVVLGLSYKGISCSLNRCNRGSPSGEAGFVNAEAALRKHLRGMNYTVHSLSCREYQYDAGIRNGFKMCQVVYSDDLTPTVRVNAVYQCDSAFQELSSGCIKMNFRINLDSGNRN